jgi:serine/threonine-protein kinase
MDYLEGESLESLVRRAGPLPPSTAVDLLLDASAIVESLHGARLFHHDLKQGNVFVEGTSTRVLELGINEALARAGQLQPGTLATPGTKTPEQWMQGDGDARVDTYALGGILYYLLTGRKAFPTGQRVLALASRLARPPAVDDIPRKLKTIIEKALAMRPEERFQTAEDFSAALARAAR